MAKKVTAARHPEARKARRSVIAKAVVAQTPTRQIAANLGISRQAVYQELAQPETKELIQSWMRPHHESIKRMIPRALATVNKGLKPSNEMRDRLNAVKTLGVCMEWAEGKKDDSNGTPLRFDGTLEELLVTFRRITTPEA